jgi:hypothetical protein
MNNRDHFFQLLSDYEVLALAYSRMDADLYQRMSDLLDRNQASTITLDEHAELNQLIAIYEHGSLLKAEATAETIRRKLMESLAT